MTLEELRTRIDTVDKELLRLFAERMEIAGNIAEYKAERNLPVLDANRENEKLLALREKAPEELKDYVFPLFSRIIELSRERQEKLIAAVRKENAASESGEAGLRCGLLGRHISSGYSPAIHASLGNYAYRLYEVEPDNVESFLHGGEFDALNVTIPYKKTAAALCDELSETARAVGSVNTILRRADGTLYGDNTDVYGFEETLRRAMFSPRAKKVLVLGDGGASAAVVYALQKQSPREIVVISRNGENNYTNLSLHADAEMIVNATPVGMYPHNGEAAVDLVRFPNCRAVVDLVYNPMRTALLLQAEERGIPYADGLTMLCAQAVRSSELFTGKPAAEGAVEHAVDLIKRKMLNIVLVGMPGCGKTVVAEALGKALGRDVLDTDAYIAEQTGLASEEIITAQGEGAFRVLEEEAVRALGGTFGAVIAVGSGAVLREDNYAPLHQNGVIFWLRRDLDKLARGGCPLSRPQNLNAMYGMREKRYLRFADYIIDNNRSLADTVADIRKAIL